MVWVAMQKADSVITVMFKKGTSQASETKFHDLDVHNYLDRPLGGCSDEVHDFANFICHDHAGHS